MRLGTLSITVTADDTPTYHAPMPFNPTGWLNLGHLVTLNMPTDPQDALEYLLALRQSIDEARAAISDAQLKAIRDLSENH